ncbi:MAG: ATP-binding protein [Phycisphaerales bacterium]|nr:MAG: ATP-binding protein [Phycisphaerales bacterium]
MIACVEALNYRCLRYVRQELGPFQVLVGPNASGKSTFLDVITLLGDLLCNGLVEAIHQRSPDLRALAWMGQNDRIELAVELVIPDERRSKLPQNAYKRARYEVAIGEDPSGELAILDETLWLKPDAHKPAKEQQLRLFPEPIPPPDSVVIGEGKHAPSGWKKVVTKKAESGNDYFFSETTKWNTPFRFGPQKLALANLPEDEDRFPVATWVKRVLMDGIQRLALNSEAMRRPAAPGSPRTFQPDGSNLPWAIHQLQKDAPERFKRWVAHAATALPDLEGIETTERPEDRHRYLSICYATGLSVPSWTTSDGTLRLLALTLLAYLGGGERVYVIEEPENGIHPAAVETVYQSLSSAYDVQVLCASHSPVVLSRAEPEQLLCFAKTGQGESAVVRGHEHPVLRDWQRGADLGTLFAAGVLG